MARRARTVVDRAIGWVSPTWEAKRLRARLALELAVRHYEGATTGRRGQGWRRSAGDVNSVIAPALSLIRERARDLVRNNPYAESALETLVDHVVGWGIEAKVRGQNDRATQMATDTWRAWAESTDCDADGRNDFVGLQALVQRTVMESGEALVRRRVRRIEDDLPLPMQLQVIEPDHLDTSKETFVTNNGGGGRIVNGVEFDALGRRTAYWLFRDHPGSRSTGSTESVRVPAENILHVYHQRRAGQVRGVSQFAPVLLTFKDFDEYEDATLMKQKIAACLAVLYTDTSGTGTHLGAANVDQPEWDMLEPGLIKGLPMGSDLHVVQPPRAQEYEPYSKTQLRKIATGLGVTYEDLTGDYQDMPFSAARMSRLRHWARIDRWRWRMLVPQFCTPAFRWAMELAVVAGKAQPGATVRWSAPPAPMVDPANEGLALQRLVRNGLDTLSNVLRERGYDPDEVLEELATDMARLDKLGLVLDIDPRRMTQAGQAQAPIDEGTREADEERSRAHMLTALGGGRR